jgi:hypothetical protein
VSTSEWQIDNFQFSFGVVSSTDGTDNAEEYYFNYANSTYSKSLLSMSYPGIGLPQAQYNLFMSDLS